MITRFNLPKGYSAFKTLTICSNTLLDGGHLMTQNEALPLVIGQGKAPQVWLQGPDKTGKHFVLLVEASKSVHRAIQVIDSEPGAVTIIAGNTEILHVCTKIADSAIIDRIDLRPIGYNVYGDSESLIAGGVTFTRNTFAGGGTLLALMDGSC